jgi:hypothetical protein
LNGKHEVFQGGQSTPVQLMIIGLQTTRFVRCFGGASPFLNRFDVHLLLFERNLRVFFVIQNLELEFLEFGHFGVGLVRVIE